MPSLKKTFRTRNGPGASNTTLFRVANPARAKLQSRNKVDNVVLTVDFPFGPQNIQHDTLGSQLSEVARPGKKPLLIRENALLRTVTFTALIADKESGGALSVVDTLDVLETLAVSAIPCKFVYGLTTLTYTVVITKFTYMIKRRNQEGAPVQVEVNLQLTEYIDVEQEIQELVAVARTVPSTQPATNYTKTTKNVPTSGNNRTTTPSPPASPSSPSGYDTAPTLNPSASYNTYLSYGIQ